jgi:hypothetical protein
MCKRKNQNLQGNPVVYWDKASGPRVETQGLANPIPGCPSFLSFLNIPNRSRAKCEHYCEIVKLSMYYASLYTLDEKENKDFDLI